MEIQYSNERNTQILIALLKKHNVKDIIISPGSTNICFTTSVQHDPYFRLFSSIDERSASYMACGLAAETGEPVALSCTGATASRNYLPGLTEAYYRHLPVLAITSTQPRERVGQNIPQVIDRSSIANDAIKKSVYIETIHNKEKEWAAKILINTALVELRRNGGGPVHIDLETTYSSEFNTLQLPDVKPVKYYSDAAGIPEINDKEVAIFVGAHTAWGQETIKKIEQFCEMYNGVVLCDHTSNYWGKYRVLPNVLSVQRNGRSALLRVPFLIHLGEISGSYLQIDPEKVWRVHPDGEIRDTFKSLECVVQTDEDRFFSEMIARKRELSTVSYYKQWEKECEKIQEDIPKLPFSNAWIAYKSAKKIPPNSAVHFGILNSFRTWNYFAITEGTLGYCNTGGFGIDGDVSSLIGASFANKDKIYFGIVGDLAFFYDMNSLGNRDIGPNVRLMVVNNGKGNEFRNYGSYGAPLGEYADDYICAARHFGNKSECLLKHYSEDLGFKYLSASNKEEYLSVFEVFFAPKIGTQPILMEVFTDTEDESRSLELIINTNFGAASKAKDVAKNILGEDGVHMIKKIIGRN